MTDKKWLDIYTDYLISSFGLTTQTGLSRLLNGTSHGRIQRFLSKESKTGKDLWLTVKPYVRQIQSDDSVIMVDDSIAEKPHTDENDRIAWHYDHTKRYSIKGINFIQVLTNGDGSVGVRLYQAGNAQSCVENQSFCTQIQALRQCLTVCIANFRYLAARSLGRVTSVIIIHGCHTYDLRPAIHKFDFR